MRPRNRHDLDAAGVVAVNVMSSPGAGKTLLLRETLCRLGDTAADRDRRGRHRDESRRGPACAAWAQQVALVNTGNGFGGECHLDAPMVRSALVRLHLASCDLVLVENVGNLVCPAEFDVGEHARAMVYSVTEGEDKPLKYPVMFRSADLVVVNKIDLLPHLDFDLAAFEANLAAVNPGVRTLRLSARTGEGLDAWCAWVAEVAGAQRAPAHSR